jgi:hypothetical protein
MKRLALIGALAALLAGAVLARAAFQYRAGTHLHHSRLLTFEGKAKHLYPGAHTDLRVRVHNRSHSEFILRSLRTNVRSGAEGCDRSNLKTGKLRRPKTVPAEGNLKLRVPVTMVLQAPDECQGVRFPLKLHGRYVKANAK